LTPEREHGYLDALRAVSEALDELSAPSMIIGGAAVIALGVPRLTVDIDATVAASGVEIGDMIATLAHHDVEPRIPEAEAFARSSHVFLGVHQSSGTPIDITLAWLPFEEEALRHRQVCDYAGVRIRVPRPDDLIIYKLVASRPRDLEDAEGLLVLHAASIDVARLRATVHQFAELLEDTERPRALQRLLEKTGLQA
jgi:hypothetical protein